VLRALSLCACCRHYPGAAAGRRPRSSHPAVTAFPDNVVGSACTSSFSRIAQRSLALRPAHSRGHLYVTCYTEGFSHFVTSMTAPVASGWSGWPGGACTHWKAPPCHGAHVKRTLRIGTVGAAVGGIREHSPAPHQRLPDARPRDARAPNRASQPLTRQSGAADDDGKDRGKSLGGGQFSGRPAFRNASNEGFKIGLRSVRNLIESWGLTLRA
jgi:hypothetical protein